MKMYTIKKATVLQFFVLEFFMMFFTLAFCQEEKSPVPHPEKYYTIIPSDTRPILVVDGSSGENGLTFTEGPSWMNGKLYFSNIHWKGKRGWQGFHVLNPDGTWEALNREVQTEGTTPLPNGNLAICDMSGRRIIEMTPHGGIVRTLADSCEGIPIGTPNDLITDAKGGIYFTQPGRTKQAGNAVYYITPQGIMA